MLSHSWLYALHYKRQLNEGYYTITDSANPITSSIRVEEVEYRWEMGVRDAFTNVCNKLIDRLREDNKLDTAAAILFYLSNWNGKHNWYENDINLSLFMKQTEGVDHIAWELSSEHGDTDDELITIANSFTGLRQILGGYNLACL